MQPVELAVTRGLMEEILVAVRPTTKPNPLSVTKRLIVPVTAAAILNSDCEIVSVASMCLIAKCDETTFLLDQRTRSLRGVLCKLRQWAVSAKCPRRGDNREAAPALDADPHG